MPDAEEISRYVLFVAGAESQAFNSFARAALKEAFGDFLIENLPASFAIASLSSVYIAIDQLPSVDRTQIDARLSHLLGEHYRYLVGIDSFLVTPSRLIHRQDGVIRDRGNVHDNIVITPLSEVSDTVLRIDNVANLPRTDDLTVTFDPQLTPEQIVATLTALADYYRACGGIGLPADFKSQEAVVPEDIHV